MILQRHLERLAADGWRITVAAEAEAPWSPPAGWRFVPLPRRRPWWPPYRNGLAWSGRLRSRLLARELRHALRDDVPDTVLTVLWGDVFTETAAAAAQAWRCPLAVLAHDRPELIAPAPLAAPWRALARRILRRAAVVWPVTDALLDPYLPLPSTRIRTLPPIPAAPRVPAVAWRDDFARRSIVVHAGRLHEHQQENFHALAVALARSGGELWLVTTTDNPVWQALSSAHAHVRRVDPFTTDGELKSFLAANATAVLVSYHFDPAVQPWAASSFPSKLIDYAALGLPALILAPPHAAAAAWARRHAYPLHVAELSPADLEAALARLANRDTWEHAAGILLSAARTEFSPDRIHAQFVTDLKLAARPPRLTTGRLWLLCVHQPIAGARKLLRRGPWDARLCAAGQRDMRAVAATLAPAPTPTRQLRTPVVFLTGRRFWEQTALCAHTLRAHLGAEVPFIVVDDETLGDREADHLRRIIPNLQIRWRHEIEARLDEQLPADRFPVLRRHRLIYPHLRKLTDVHAALGPGWKLVLDSDMLFFRRPLHLAEWLRDPIEPCFATDVGDAYGYPHPLLESLAGVPVPHHINVGLVGLHSEDLDWNAIETWTRELLARHGAHYYLEQALSAMLIGRLGGGLRLPPELYVVLPSRTEARHPARVLHHYVADSKSSYLRSAWREALRRAAAIPPA